MSDQQREQFETELATELARYYPAGAESIEASLKRMRDGDSYADKSVTGAGMAWAAKYAWWAWRQSRACCVVELPQLITAKVDSYNIPLLNADATLAAIEAAGVKVAQ